MAKDLTTILQRVEHGDRALENYKHKVHRLRRIVAGDTDALSGVGIGAAIDTDAEHYNKRRDDFYDIFVNETISGRSNQLLQHIRSQVLQTSFQFPEIEMTGLDEQSEALNESYFRIRMGNEPMGCNAQEQLKLTLYDFLVGGLGWGRIGIKNGMPGVFHADTLDMIWDQQARIMTDIRWCAQRIRQPAYYWRGLYGSKAGISPETTDDELVELTYYYDIIDNGRHVIFNFEGLDAQTPVKDEENPYYYIVQGQKIPFLPYESANLMMLPSVRLPYGVVEQMLPAQLAIHQAEEYIYDVIERCKGHFEYEIGTYEPEDEKAMRENGEIGLTLRRKSGKQPGTWIPPQDPPPSIYAWRDQNEREMTAQSGDNPYQSGNVAPGIQYASEVAAIQGNAGLMAASIAKVNASLWERIAKKFLAAGDLYDDMPITIRDLPVPGSTATIDMDFNQQNPVAQFLRPDATLAIHEDSMKFKSREQKIAEAKEKFQTALTVAQLYPNAIKTGYKKYLKAFGERNVEEWMAQPAAPPMGMPQAGAAPPVDPQQIAQKQAVSGAMQPSMGR